MQIEVFSAVQVYFDQIEEIFDQITLQAQSDLDESVFRPYDAEVLNEVLDAGSGSYDL